MCRSNECDSVSDNAVSQMADVMIALMSLVAKHFASKDDLCILCFCAEDFIEVAVLGDWIFGSTFECAFMDAEMIDKDSVRLVQTIGDGGTPWPVFHCETAFFRGLARKSLRTWDVHKLNIDPESNSMLSIIGVCSKTHITEELLKTRENEANEQRAAMRAFRRATGQKRVQRPHVTTAAEARLLLQKRKVVLQEDDSSDHTVTSDVVNDDSQDRSVDASNSLTLPSAKCGSGGIGAKDKASEDNQFSGWSRAPPGAVEWTWGCFKLAPIKRSGIQVGFGATCKRHSDPTDARKRHTAFFKKQSILVLNG
jgi:hypothetical protein